MDTHQDPKSGSSRLFVTSLKRGLNLLEALANAERPQNLTELSRALGLDKVTAGRFCYTLAEMGYIEKTPEKQYRLTPAVLNLGYAVVCGYDLSTVAEPYLRGICRQIGETVNMAVLDGADVLYVARFKTEQLMAKELRIGSKLPAYCTSMGKAILAYLPGAELESILDRTQFAALTHRTLVSREALLSSLEEIRARGFATNDEELSVGLRSVAAPIMRGGRPAAAVNIAVPTSRYSMDELISRAVPNLLETVGEISRMMQRQVGVQQA